MERIKTSTHMVGLKQTKKAIEENRAQLVFIADDADSFVTLPLKKLCEEKSIEIVCVSTMKELGKACHIDVPTAVAAIVKGA